MSKSSVAWFDRIISCLSYITAGWAGLIFCVIMYFRRKRFSHFARFNIFQSIFISLFYFVIAMALGLVCDLLTKVPVINIVVSFVYFLFNVPIFMEYSLIQLVIFLLVLYMAVFSLFGRYPRVYWISRIIDSAAS